MTKASLTPVKTVSENWCLGHTPHDRKEVSAGEKFVTADLIGIPCRLVVSRKTGDKIEFKKRDSEKTELLTMDDLIKRLKEEKESLS